MAATSMCPRTTRGDRGVLRGADGALSQLPARGAVWDSPLFDEGCAPGPAKRGHHLLQRRELRVRSRRVGDQRIRAKRPEHRPEDPGAAVPRSAESAEGERVDAGRLRRAAVRLDRRLIRSSARPRFRVVVPARRLATRGGHRWRPRNRPARPRRADRSTGRRMRSRLILAGVALAMLAPTSGAQAAVLGSLTQLAGPAAACRQAPRSGASPGAG